MSNSIWKKPTVRPVKDCIVVWQNPAHMYFTLPRTARKYMEMYNCERWSTLDDLIAQADKAERLQKAVDLAQEHLLSISDGYDIMKADAETIKRLFYAIQDEASDTHKEIKQLIKETTNDK